MKNLIALLAAGAIAASLSACVYIDDDVDDSDDLDINTKRAVEVCGPGGVAEVSEDSFKCKEDR